VTRHLAAYRERPAWATVGQVLDLAEIEATAAREAPASKEDFIALTPSGERATFANEKDHVLELAEQGFYEVRRPSRQSGAVFVTASNVELAEGDRTPLDPQDMVVAVTGGAGGNVNGGQPVDLPDEAHERAQRLWWYLLFAGILLLTAESLLAHRISAKAAA
jgi:hypothetical protein